jgi:hypothetical protein
MNIELSGFGELERQLKEAERAGEALQGTLVTLKFNPSDPSDVERAITQAERLIDVKLAPYGSNPFVAPLVEEMKKLYRDETRKLAQKSENS